MIEIQRPGPRWGRGPSEAGEGEALPAGRGASAGREAPQAPAQQGWGPDELRSAGRGRSPRPDDVTPEKVVTRVLERVEVP
jgi:hypothetical protein